MAVDVRVEHFTDAIGREGADDSHDVPDDAESAALLSGLGGNAILNIIELDCADTEELPHYVVQREFITEVDPLGVAEFSSADEVEPKATQDATLAIGSMLAARVIEDVVPELAVAGEGGDDRLPPTDHVGAADAESLGRSDSIRIEGKVWPYGGERGDVAESDAIRLHEAVQVLIRSGWSDSKGYRLFKDRIALGSKMRSFELQSASRGVRLQQAAENDQSGSWDGATNAIRIYLPTVRAVDGTVSRSLMYFIFRPDQLQEEEDFRQMVLKAGEPFRRPRNWSLDPTTWDRDEPVVIRSEYDLEVLERPYADPILRAIGERVEANQARTVAKARELEASGHLLEHTHYDGPDKHGNNGSKYLFREFALNNPADADAVLQDLRVMYTHHPNVQLIENPASADPIKAIEIAQARVYAELQRTIGIAVPEPLVSDIETFQMGLGLTSTTRAMACSTPDTVPDTYATWPEYITQNLVKNGHSGAFYPNLNLTVVPANFAVSAIDFAHTAVHERVGHGSEVHRIAFVQTADGIYFWHFDGGFNAIYEARASFLGVNFTHLYMGKAADGYIVDVMGRVPLMASDKYDARGSGYLTPYGSAATTWELLIGLDQSIFEPFVAGDKGVLAQKVNALCPGLYEQMEQIKSKAEFDRGTEPLFAAVMAKYGLENLSKTSNTDTRAVMAAIKYAHNVVVDLFNIKLGSAAGATET